MLTANLMSATVEPHEATHFETMKTAFLPLVAAAFAASLVSSQAQSNVYSANIVGYVNLPCAAGSVANPSFTLIGNPLKASPNNTVGAVFGANAPADLSVLTWNGVSFDENASYGGGVWDDDTVDVSPGKGFFVKSVNASPITLTFVGEVMTGCMTNVIDGYFSLLCGTVPQPGDIRIDLGLNPVADDSILTWNGASFDENVYYGGGTWDGDPIMAVAQGFFYKQNPIAPVHTIEWIRCFYP